MIDREREIFELWIKQNKFTDLSYIEKNTKNENIIDFFENNIENIEEITNDIHGEKNNKTKKQETITSKLKTILTENKFDDYEKPIEVENKPKVAKVIKLENHMTNNVKLVRKCNCDSIKLNTKIEQKYQNEKKDKNIKKIPKFNDVHSILISKKKLTNPFSRAYNEKKKNESSKTAFDNASYTNAEIYRMRTSLLAKKNILKKNKEFFDEKKNFIGNKISEGHENFVMAYNMLTGIRVAVSRCSGVMRKLIDNDFKNTKSLMFTYEGSEYTPSSKYNFKFKDYCPEVFKKLRYLFGLDPADYLVSVTGKYILSELSSPGKSGSFFYYSRDFRFIIKTIHHSEHKNLRKILKDYYYHVKKNPNTLLSHFYGLHRLAMPFILNGKKKIHFIIMKNFFPPHKDIHIKYDLKGSSTGRYTNIKSKSDDLILKDLNWLEKKEMIEFGPEKSNLFLTQLNSDVLLLKKHNLMDYSLLIGIHDMIKGSSIQQNNKLSYFDFNSPVRSELFNSNVKDPSKNAVLPVNNFQLRFKFLFYGENGGIVATNDKNEPLSKIYYLGIIDCLTDYSVKKKIESLWKSFYNSKQSISAVLPNKYADRFISFITNITEFH